MRYSGGCAARYCAGPVTSTRQVASVTRPITSSESVTDLTSSDGGANNALANTLLTAQLMFWGIESVAAI